MKDSLFSLATLLTLSLANPQNYGSPDSKSTSAAPATSAAAAAASSGGTVHTVDVGDGAFTFKPDTLTANVGDVIQFQLYPTHSVARSSFADPCQPMTGAASIWSGFSSNENTFFTVTVNDTTPIWMYCAAPTHCQIGMSMVINPPSGGNNIAAYQSAAKGVANSGTPANLAGGVFGKAAAASGSAASGSSGSASSTATSSAPVASASAGGAMGLVADAMLVAGAVVGGAAFLV